MKITVELVFLSADGLKLYKRADGIFFVKNQKELLSIIGCILIDCHSRREDDREIASNFLQNLLNNKIISTETGEQIVVKF